MSKEVLDILERIGAERNISTDALFRSLEDALVSASRKVLGPYIQVSKCEFDSELGEFRVFATKLVVDTVEEEELEISLQEARETHPNAQVGDEIDVDVTPADFGRIAAQSAKQVLTQRIHELEREMVFERYQNRVGELVSGTVQRYDRGNVIVDLGSAEALLPHSEQAFGEKYHYGDKLKAVISDVRRSSRDQQIILSRRAPELVKMLFVQEVNEMQEGVVTIRLIAREAGKRSKIAVSSNDSNVDPVGACVGIKGSRVQMVVQELRGERIDIIEFSSDRKRFVANSLKPAEVLNVEMLDETKALVIVKDDMLSLAIGKQGLNAKLASELTGVEVDVISDREYQEQEKAVMADLMLLDDVNEVIAGQFMAANVFALEDLMEVEDPEVLTQIEGIDSEMAVRILDQATDIVAARLEADEAEEVADAGEAQEETAETAEATEETTATEREDAAAEPTDGEQSEDEPQPSDKTESELKTV